MWYSSNMFLKKLITNLCFPKPTLTSTNKPQASVNPPSFNTHLSRHFSTCKDHQPNKNHAKNKEKMIEYTSITTPEDDIEEEEDDDIFFTSSSNSDELISNNLNQPNLHTMLASNRFFISSPGHSKSITDQQPTSNDNSDHLLLSAGGVPVPKYSPDPYWDFRKSMQEMVDAKVKGSKMNPAENLEYMHQLLTCYLTLNPINTHECIIKAFSDLLVNFVLENKSDNDRIPPPSGSRRVFCN